MSGERLALFSVRPLRNARAGSVARAGKSATGAANSDEDRVARRRGVLAQSGASRRGRRPGARGLSQAARSGPRRQRIRRRSDRGRQDARSGRGILARRSAAHRRTAEPARQGLSRTVGLRGEAAGRRRSAAGGAAGAERQAFLRSRMDAKPVLRFSQAGLSAHRAAGPTHWCATPRPFIRIPSKRPSSICGRSPMRCRRRISS